jgi:hypothetical protein
VPGGVRSKLNKLQITILVGNAGWKFERGLPMRKKRCWTWIGFFHAQGVKQF